MTKKSSKHLEILAAHVASGRTIRAAAELIGIAESTAYGISSSSEFRAAVARLRTEAVGAAIGILSQAASQAALTLVALLGAENDPKDRLSAARLILANLGPLSEHGELRERLDSMESQTQLKVVQ